METSDFPVTAVIVSFLPYDYSPQLSGLLPSAFHIPAAEPDDFVVVPITDCMEHVYLLDGKTLPRMISGREVAGSIAYDLLNATPSVSNNSKPGIKSLPGNLTKEQIINMFPDELEQLRLMQRNWYGELVKVADDTWNDPNARGKHQSISDVQRIACRRLGLNREWLTAVVTNNVPCFACGFMVLDTALICMNCKTVLKPDEYSKRAGSVPVEVVKEAQPEATK